MQNKQNIVASRIAEKCAELASLATSHGLETLALVLRMGVLEAQSHEAPGRVDVIPSPPRAPCIVGCWNWDVTSNKVYGTRQFAEFYNVDPRLAAAGAPIELFIEAIHPLDQDRVSQAMEIAIKTGEDYEIEYRVVGKDHVIRWVRARGRCWREEEGRPLHFPGSLVDITHEKRIRAA